MSRRVLLCEGPDDRAALREIVCRIFRYAKASNPAEQKESWSLREVTLDLVVAQDKERVLRRAADLLVSNSPSEPIERMGLSFDPNGHDEAEWRRWMEAGLEGLGLARDGWSYQAGGVVLVPIPWEWPSPRHYGLPEKQSLERVAIDLLAATSAPQHELIAKWMGELSMAAHPVSWKTAARLWNALVRPDAAEHGFFGQVFGQHAPTRDLLAQRLPGTSLGEALRLLLD